MSSQYRSLLNHADQHFHDIQAAHPTSFACCNGCHACCEPDLTVLPIEAANIRRFIQENPSVQQKLQIIQQTDPHHGTRCAMLDADGACSIYPVRPFICRSHGAPIAIAREDYFQIDVCPLNFTQNPIEELGPENFFILDDWNDQLLSTDTLGTRVPLTLEGIITAT